MPATPTACCGWTPTRSTEGGRSGGREGCRSSCPGRPAPACFVCGGAGRVRCAAGSRGRMTRSHGPMRGGAGAPFSGSLGRAPLLRGSRVVRLWRRRALRSISRCCPDRSAKTGGRGGIMPPSSWRNGTRRINHCEIVSYPLAGHRAVATRCSRGPPAVPRQQHRAGVEGGLSPPPRCRWRPRCPRPGPRRRLPVPRRPRSPRRLRRPPPRCRRPPPRARRRAS